MRPEYDCSVPVWEAGIGWFPLFSWSAIKGCSQSTLSPPCFEYLLIVYSLMKAKQSKYTPIIRRTGRIIIRERLDRMGQIDSRLWLDKIEPKGEMAWGESWNLSNPIQDHYILPEIAEIALNDRIRFSTEVDSHLFEEFPSPYNHVRRFFVGGIWSWILKKRFCWSPFYCQ